MKLELLHIVAKNAFDAGVSSRNAIHVQAYIKMVIPPRLVPAAQAALTAMLRELEAQEMGYHCMACKLYEDTRVETNKGNFLSIYV
jgi:hypothetical protein